MAAVSRNLEQLGRHFALHSRTAQGLCMQNIAGISVIMGAGLEWAQRIEHIFCLQWRRQLQTYQTHIDPTLHVGPHNK